MTVKESRCVEVPMVRTLLSVGRELLRASLRKGTWISGNFEEGRVVQYYRHHSHSVASIEARFTFNEVEY